MMAGTGAEFDEERLKFANNCGNIQVVFKPQFATVCSIGRAPFWGTLVIEYVAEDVLLEFEAFEEWLHSIALIPTTVEGITRQVFDLLWRVLGDIDALSVACHAQTPVHGPAIAQLSTQVAGWPLRKV